MNFLVVFTGQASLAYEQPISNYPSSIDGITIPNSHFIGQNVIRGATPPDESWGELTTLGITDVLIFKRDNHGEVGNEVAHLQSLGYSDENITHISFPWRNLGDPELACKKIVRGLNLLIDIENSPNRRAFFHCSIGEDRTGLLAGLFRMITQGWKRDQAFYHEMCPRGYADGNPEKEAHVAEMIHAELTPMFIGMARLIERGDVQMRYNEESVCDGFLPAAESTARRYRCQPREK